MSLNIKTATKIEEVANFIFLSILNQLKSGKHVLFFVTGGSSISVAVEISKLLQDHSQNNLTIMLTDERYGTLDHIDSNWNQLIQKGFNLPQAKLIPILTGDDFEMTIEKFNKNLACEFNVSDYTIGLFGVGKDGHTAGIIPNNSAVTSKELACGHHTETFSRITITPKIIKEFNEAVVFMQGKEKWDVVENFNKNIDIMEMPAQILKKVPLLTIFTDYSGSQD